MNRHRHDLVGDPLPVKDLVARATALPIDIHFQGDEDVVPHIDMAVYLCR